MRYFCEACHRNFVADRYSEPRCPHCGYFGTCIIPNPERQYDGPVPCEHGRSDIQNCDECAVVGDIDPPAQNDGEVVE